MTDLSLCALACMIRLPVQLYGVLEHAHVHCGWIDGAPPPLNGTASSSTGSSSTDSCAAASQGVCDKPDSWVAACASMCVCNGYQLLLGAGVAVLAGVGLTIHVVLLREQHSGSSAQGGGASPSEQAATGGMHSRQLGSSGGGAQGKLSLKSRQWRAARLQGKGKQASSLETQALVDVNEPAEGLSDQGEDWDESNLDDGGTGHEAGRTLGRKQQGAIRLGGGASELQPLQMELPQARPGPAGSSVSGGMCEAWGGLWRFTLGRGPGGRSTAVLCVAGA